MQPAASVVISVDYAAGTPRAWRDLEATLVGLSKQSFAEPTEVIFVEQSSLLAELPRPLLDIVPHLRVLPSGGETAFDLQLDGARAARSDIVVFLDADCIPEPGWLGLLITALRERPETAVVSSLTRYAGGTPSERILGLLTRAFDEADTAPTKRIANNASAFRKDVFLEHLPSNAAGPFGSSLQSERIRRAGHLLLYEPRAVVVHAFGGWPMERSIRRHLGYAAFAKRRSDPGMRWSALVRGGYALIPLAFAYRVLLSWRSCLRSHRRYGLRLLELPLALAAAVGVRALEVPGMVDAVRGRSLDQTAYR